MGAHLLQNGTEGAESGRALGGQALQEYLRPLLAGLLPQYLLVFPQGENLVVDQAGQHGAHVQLAQHRLPVPLEDPGRPSLLPPAAGPPAGPLLLLLPLLLPHKPPLGAAAEHLQAEETHQNLEKSSVNAGPEGQEAHRSRQGSNHATYVPALLSSESLIRGRKRQSGHWLIPGWVLRDNKKISGH